MAVDPSQLSLAEIEERFLRRGESATSHFLKKLQRDRRQGARRLHAALARRRERQRDEERRLTALLHFERLLWRSGLRHLAGVDEAGMGPLAGPVVAAAVVFPPEVSIAGIDDSKRLDAGQRDELEGEIRRQATGVGIGLAAVAEIDELNVYQAGLVAMRRAVEALPVHPQHLLVDARRIPDCDVPQSAFEKGDGLNFSIAAASILAKTHRDRLMEELDARYPRYGFAQHKGYATPEHQEAIRRHGPSPVHRCSYTFLKELCGEYSERFYELQERLVGAAGRRELARFEDDLTALREELPEAEYKKLRLTLGRRWKAL